MCVCAKCMCVCMHAGFIVLLTVDVNVCQNGCFFLPNLAPDLNVRVTLNRVNDFPRAVLPASVCQQARQIKGWGAICEQLCDHTAAKINMC